MSDIQRGATVRNSPNNWTAVNTENTYLMLFIRLLRSVRKFVPGGAAKRIEFHLNLFSSFAVKLRFENCPKSIRP
jgi:hypothetical protein